MQCIVVQYETILRTKGQPVSVFHSPDGRKFHSKEAIKEGVEAGVFKHLEDEGLLIDNRKKGNRMKRYVIFKKS